MNQRIVRLALSILLWNVIACTKDEKVQESQPPPPSVKTISITDLKALSTEASVKIGDVGLIRGVVISDADSKNIDNNKTLFLQEGTNQSGIMVTLQMDHHFALNDSLEIEISHQTLSSLNGAVVLQNLPNINIKKVGVGHIAPRETSINELKANKMDWEGSLVRIKACELITDNGKYSGNMKIRDGQATLASHVVKEAKFSDQEIPDDIRSVVGIARMNGSEVQLALRKSSEILPLTYVTDEFTTWKNTSWTFNLAMEEYALHTKYANWYGSTEDGAIKQLANAADIGFTKAGKIYPYLPKDSLTSALWLYPTDNSSLKGLKVIKVTFAASKSLGDVRFLEQSVGNRKIAINVLPFNTGIDEARIGLEIPIESTGEPVPGKLVIPKGFDDYHKLVSWSSPVKETGKFYTATFMIPSTKEDLLAMGIDATNGQKWLDNPKLKIVNLSARKTQGITTRNPARYIPILIDKVEMGF